LGKRRQNAKLRIFLLEIQGWNKFYVTQQKCDE
jgi:hypothetical protein